MHQRLEGGRELSVGPKQGSKECPLITIITSTFNAANDLHWTIESIRSQTYPNIQWIVVDGGSRDNTVDILKANEDIIDYWFSEPDNGIYDAWNKTLPYARGEWVQFIGAGDELSRPSTLSEVALHLSRAYPKYELVYGKIDIISQSTRNVIERRGKPWNEMKNKWFGILPAVPTHPEVFHHISILQNIDVKIFKVAGDLFIMLSSIRRKEPLFIDIIIDSMPDGGVSDSPKNIKLIREETHFIKETLNIKTPYYRVIFYEFKTNLKIFIYSVFGHSSFKVFSRCLKHVGIKQSR